MTIPLPCSCGKTLKVKEELAGKRIKCPACNQVLTVPVPELEPVEAATASDLDEGHAGRSHDEPKKKKKKKKKKSLSERLAEKEDKDKEFERETERRQKIKRLFRGSAYVILGVIITALAIYAIFTFGSTLIDPNLWHYGALVALILLVGLAAIGKGTLSLLFGQDTD